jgi:ribosomal protein L19E
MGGIGNLVVNTVVRMPTRKAVGKDMKSVNSESGKRKKSRAKKKGSAKGKKDAR